MKKNLQKILSGVFLLSATGMMAQPTLTAIGINPVVGESYSLTYGNYVSPGAGGAGLTWNISTITPGASSTINHVTPSSTSAGSSFPTSNVAFYNGSNAGYYKTSSTAWQNLGFDAGGTILSYSDPEDLLHFPFTYNNSYVDTWATTFISGGTTFYRTGSTSVEADGWGTLTTPTTVYTNVTRVHFVQTYQDSSNYMGMPNVIQYENDEYLWYRDGAHCAIAYIYTVTSDLTLTQGSAYVTGSVGLMENTLAADLQLYPNPAADFVNLVIQISDNAELKINVINAIGQQMSSMEQIAANAGHNQIAIPVNELTAGVYFVQMFADGSLKATQRMVVIH